jgi:hypothetical protein
MCLATLPLQAQGYRARIDARTRVAAYRGVQLDSVPVGQVQTGATGGPISPEGFAVRCAGANPFCHFFRPGAVRQGGPVTATADVTVWGLGVAGLSLHGLARLGTNLGDTDAWPGTDPAGQVLEAYAEYARRSVTAQAGRLQSLSRLGAVGLDGGRVTVRLPFAGMQAAAFGGYSLARASALPLTSPALNPLDDYQPRERFLLAGAEVAAAAGPAALRAVYQREVDPATDYFASERAGVDGTLQPLAGLSVIAGADYDLARGLWGSAELQVSFSRGPAGGMIGARRYRPHFDLWTIWGAFSPVGYSAAFGSVRVTPWEPLQLSATAERYWYSPAEAETPLTDVEADGWRWSAGARFNARDDMVLDVVARVEYGPGASSRGLDASLSFQPAGGPVGLTVHGGALERPLEFRFSESNLWFVGAIADWRVTEALTLSGGVSRYRESRDRPDPAAFDWNQVRAHAGLSWIFGSSPDRMPLPPAWP